MQNDTLNAPIRPLPPLLPLSDPGPRLLPSTLALHRASHLLSSRNLVSEPLPHPLPPSLHPPAPVDLAEFDIDFILAGSLSQLGGDSALIKNVPIDVRRKDPGIPPTPTLQLGAGGDEEDTFAKFVGEFDDEYGDRRGEWTFRACPSRSPGFRDSTDSDLPKAEWESPGAGKYELFADGRSRSAQRGGVWRVRRMSSREYELAEIRRNTEKPPSGSVSARECYILACKLSHCESGGVKLPKSPVVARSPSADEPAASRLRVSISESSTTERTARLGSQDSNATAIAKLGQSLPASSVPITPTKSRISHREVVDALHERSRASISFGQVRSYPQGQKKRDKTHKDPEPEDKKKGLGGVFKRGLMASIKHTVAAHEEKKAMREERERERIQSQSWSPSGTSRARTYRVELEGSIYREGKAWNVVPDEAVAVVVPIEGDELRSPNDRPPHHNPLFADGTRQALLVWYVPFNSDFDERPTTASTSSSVHHTSDSSSGKAPELSTSLPKLHKLLRRHASKDREAMKRDKATTPRPPIEPTGARSLEHEQISTTAVSRFLSPLPFRSFRVVARVVDVDDLRSEPDIPATTFDQWQEQHRTSPNEVARAVSSSSSNPSPNRPQPSLPSIDDVDASSNSTAPTSTIMPGRTFPTVIAVCHSRSQGVEFVLEGLDRLGFCKGESAWGPTGYEEWRGSGLSDKGRELLDFLWAGCTGVMGLAGR